jgi:hypothetical protein
VDSVVFEVDSAGEVRYVTCEGITEYVTFGIGPQAINECIENNSLFALSATISFVSYGSPCVVPTPTPTATPLTLTVYTFYRASEVLESNVSTTYCNNFGPPNNGQGYVMSQPFYTIDSVLTPGTTVIYSDSDLTTVYSGSWEYNTNETLIAYINQSEYDTIPYRTTTDPDGDGTYSGGSFKYIRVDSSGIVQDSGTYSCSGGANPF